MKFLVDANLPPALARWLVTVGHEAHHVSEFGLERNTSPRINRRSLHVMAGLVPAIHVFDLARKVRRGCPRQARA